MSVDLEVEVVVVDSVVVDSVVVDSELVKPLVAYRLRTGNSGLETHFQSKASKDGEMRRKK